MAANDLLKVPEDVSELKELPARPVLFMFQPKYFAPIPNDRLGEWEQLVAERVGIKGISVQSDMMCVSFCEVGGGRVQGCDCDML